MLRHHVENKFIMEVFHTMHSCSQSINFIQTKFTLYVKYTYIYHVLPPTCFDVCYTIFRETIVLFAQELAVFL